APATASTSAAWNSARPLAFAAARCASTGAIGPPCCASSLALAATSASPGAPAIDGLVASGEGGTDPAVSAATCDRNALRALGLVTWSASFAYSCGRSMQPGAVRRTRIDAIGPTCLASEASTCCSTFWSQLVDVEVDGGPGL